MISAGHAIKWLYDNPSTASDSKNMDSTFPNEHDYKAPNRCPSYIVPEGAKPLETLSCIQSVPHTSETIASEIAPNTSERISKLSLNSLPSELLLEIFRYATYIPRSRTITPCDAFAPEISHNFAWNVNTPVMAMRTKCVLVLVCKAWRELATELLYEHIVIRSLRKAKLVYRTLSESADSVILADKEKEKMPQDDGLYAGYGRCVRHLEVYSGTRASNRRPFLQFVAAIAIRCSALQFLSGIWTRMPPMEFLQAILKRHKQTLSGLSWTQSMYSFSLNDSVIEPLFRPGILKGFNQLRVLELRTLPRYYSLSTQAMEVDGDSDAALVQTIPPSIRESGIVLPHVSTLHIAPVPAVLAFASNISLPSLNALIIDSSNTSSYLAEVHPLTPSALSSSPLTYALLQFLSVHGGSITSLEIIPPSNKQRLSARDANEVIDGVKGGYLPSPFPISPALFLQLGVCPNLDSLIFDCRERSMVHPISFSTVIGSHRRQANGRQFASPTPSDEIDDIPSPPTAIIFDVELPTPIPSQPTLLAHPHTTLRRIGIRGLDVARLYPSKPCHSQTHLLALLKLKERSNDLLPSLNRVQTIGLLPEESWDMNAKDIFIWWTEQFDAVVTDLLDGECVLWLYDLPSTVSRANGESKSSISDEGGSTS